MLYITIMVNRVNNDIDLLHNLVSSYEKIQKKPLPDDIFVHLFVAGLTSLILILLLNVANRS